MLAGIGAGALAHALLVGAAGDQGDRLASAALGPLAAALGLTALLLHAARRRAGEAEAVSSLLRRSIEVVPCQFAVFDADRRLIACNESYRALHPTAFATLPGPPTYPELMRITVSQTHPPDEVEAEVARRVAAHDRSDGTPFERQYPDGRWMHITKKRLPGGEVAGFAMDITALKQAQQQVDHLARHDPLTGLPNRAAFAATLQAALAQPSPVALLLVDLDRFKAVNDRHGHAAGDALLRATGRRLKAALRVHDQVARLGGDEFGVILHGLDENRARALAGRLHTELLRPVPFGDIQLPTEASIGLALSPDHAQDAEALQRAADLALYAVKRGGRSGVAVFSRELAMREMRGSLLRAALAETLETGAGLHLAWQLQCDLGDRRVVGAEALLRWRCAALDAGIDPGEALQVADAAGMSARLDAMVLDRALAQAAAWRGRPGAPPVVAVNLTATSLADGALPARVATALARHTVAAEALEIEIPESIAAGELDPMLPSLHALAEMGVRLALDDFGGGRSSLAHALRLPVRRVKLDRSIVAGLPGAARSRAMLRAIAALARSMELELLAEGVETEAQAFALRREGVVIAQGYLFGRPVPADQLLAPPGFARAV